MPPTNRGFTLLELLVAIAIMALIGVMSWQVLSTVLHAREISDSRLKRLDDVQRCLRIMESDWQQVIVRPVTDELGGMQPSVVTTPESGVEFTRSGWLNPMHEHRSELIRIRYVLRQQALHRLSWNLLDRAPGAKPHDVVLLRDVGPMEIKLLDDSNLWQSTWPSAADAQKSARDQSLPRAVDWHFTVAGFGELRKVIVLPTNIETGNASKT